MSVKPSLKPKIRLAGESLPKKHLHLFGVSHKFAGIEIREKLSFSEEQESTFIAGLLNDGVALEAVVFSTCNRTEVVVASALQLEDLTKKLEKRLSSFSGLSVLQVKKVLYVASNEQAVSHLFKVSSGLDSMVLGEPQVTGQIKASFKRASDFGSTGSMLNRLFQRAFGATKLVRTNTGIGRKAVSVSYAAKELAQQIFGSFDEVSVLLIGAGQTGELASKHLYSAGVTKFVVANRTFEKAVNLAAQLGGKAVELAKVDEVLASCDIVIGASSVKTSQYLVNKDAAKSSIKERLGRPQFYIDLGVPRNFDLEIDSLGDTFLYTVDDLQEVVKQNVDSRSLEVGRAELIVEQEVQRFYQWFEMRKLEPAIKLLKSHFESVAAQEVLKTTKRLKRAGYAVSQDGELEKSLEAMANSVIAKLLHGPILEIKRGSESDEMLSQRVLELFLDTE